MNRRTLLTAIAAGVGGMTSGVLAGRRSVKPLDEDKGEPSTATVSFDMLDAGLPHTVSIEVTDWGDADAIRIYCPSAVQSIQTVDRGNQGTTIDNLELTAGMMVESVHGEWRTTIGKRWVHGDPPHLEDEAPTLEESGEWLSNESDGGEPETEGQ